MLSTLFGVLLMTLMMMGVRLLFMQTIQKRRERENRQINERLRTLIAAYKVLGGSFTGNLMVNPEHVRDLKSMTQAGERSDAELEPDALDDDSSPTDAQPPSEFIAERQRRIRDTVEAALSDIILLGTEAHVRMAAQAAQDMVAGRPVATAELVTSLRQFIREALYLETIPHDVAIPNQGPLRPATMGGANGRRGPGGGEGAASGGAGARVGGGAAGGQAGGGMGMGGMGLGMGMRRADDA